jgi:hydroxyisourate hydrolase
MSVGKLTTHVLDTASGRPAAGLALTLARRDDGGWQHLAEFTTNADGRADVPLLVGEAVKVGTYRLTFAVDGYFAVAGHPDAGRFLRTVPIEFCIDDPEAHYHVPLLVSPWSYSTYRGS